MHEPTAQGRSPGNGRQGAGAQIVAVGAYLPETELTSEEIEGWLHADAPPGWLEQLSGVRARRVATPGTPGSTLASLAIKDMLEGSGYSVADLDCIIVGSAAPDCIEPSTANMVQAELGASGAAFDVSNACNGFLTALQVADALVSKGSFGAVAVACGEVLSPFIPWDLARESRDPLNYIGALTLGDGGGAALVTPATGQPGIRAMRFHSEGELWEAAVVKSGGSRFPGAEANAYFSCEVKPLYQAAYRVLPGMIQQLLDEVRWKASEVDLVVPHQVSVSAVANIGCMFGWTTDDAVFSLDDYGNTAAASMPIAMHRALGQGRLREGSRVVMVGAAAGFSAGVAAIEWRGYPSM
ncbi:MAG: 3-oxoacyl-ACP synthase III family protein [Candidatus Binatia bacterium]